MNKAVVVLMISAISILSQAQTMLNPVAFKLNNRDYKGSILSLDGYLSKRSDTDKSHAQCSNQIAQQMIKLSKEKNVNFISYTKAIGAKLKKIDDRCKYFRFEIIDYVDENGFMSIRLAYRCYAMNSNQMLPYQRVSDVEPAIIQPGMFAKHEELIESRCNALEIIKGLSAKPAESMNNDNETMTAAKTSATRTSAATIKKIPSNNTKKGSGQN